MPPQKFNACYTPHWRSRKLVFHRLFQIETKLRVGYYFTEFSLLLTCLLLSAVIHLFEAVIRPIDVTRLPRRERNTKTIISVLENIVSHFSTRKLTINTRWFRRFHTQKDKHLSSDTYRMPRFRRSRKEKTSTSLSRTDKVTGNEE